MEEVLIKLEDIKIDIIKSGDPNLLDLIERAIDHIIWMDFDSKHSK